MPGRLRGKFFKLVTDNMDAAAAAVLPAQMRRRLAEMHPETLYPWDDYIDLIQTLAAKLPAAVLVDIGRRIIVQSREPYAAAGFTSSEQILRDWGALFNNFIQGAPARDLVRTESFAPGRLSVIAGIAQPAGLVEGYIRGVVEGFDGATVTSCEVTTLISGGANYNRIVLTWTS